MNIVASIIIPVHNRQEELEQLLLQLAHQQDPAFEVVLVDDGSEPPVDITPIEEKLPFSVVIKRHAQRSGVGKARNTGVATASQPLLIFVDSDGDIPDQDWFQKHMSLHEKGKALAAAQGKEFCVVHSEVQGVGTSWWGKVDGYSNWYGSTGPRSIAVRDRHVPTHNTSVEKAVFEYVGPFDEEMEVLEDVEWGHRCLKLGVCVYYLPGAPIRHLDRNSFKAVWRHYERFGIFAPLVRKKLKQSVYSFLYPQGSLSAVFLFFPLTSLMTLYISLRWVFHRPQVLFYLPGLYLANVAFYIGLCKGLRKL